MKKITNILIGLFLFSIFSLHGQNTGRLDIKALEKYIENARVGWEIPGIAVALVKDGKTIYAKGFGVLEEGKKDKVDENTIFGIASNTKAFTAAALAVLVDQGKINWNDKVQDYIPWFQLYDPYVSANMTIRDLLSHRSGLKTFSGDLIWYASNHSREEIIRRARYLEPAYGFREKFGYSNIMFLTAGQIVEYLTDTTWDNFVTYHFLQPLGMERTGTSISSFSEQKNIAKPHNLVKDKNVVIPFVNWDNIAPAGGINSSVKEMSEWMKMQLNRGELNGKRYFSEKVSYDMWQSVTPFAVSKGSESIHPSMHWRSYGLGWNLMEYQGQKVANHSGGLDGMISRVALVPEENFGLVILTNNINGLSSYLMYEILDRYFGKEGKDWAAYGLERSKKYEEYEKQMAKEEEKSRKLNTKPSLDISEYTGTYSGNVYGSIEIKEINGELKAYFEHTPLFEGDMEHWHFDTFTIELKKVPSLPKGKVQFILDENAKVKKLVVDIPNPDFDFTELDFKKEN